jgi:hypothetical protein
MYTYAGSWYTANGKFNLTAMGGTWRCMGECHGGGTGGWCYMSIWVRIS